MKPTTFLRNVLTGACLLGLAACDNGDGGMTLNDAGTDAADSATTDAGVAMFYGVDSLNRLVRFAPTAPDSVSSVAITGLMGGELVTSIDVRPANGLLYALTDGSRLYTLNPETGAATPVGSQLATILSGLYHGIDVNPVADRLRIFTYTQQNLRVNPDDATVAATDGTPIYVDGDPNDGTVGHLADCAYINNTVGSASTALFALDAELDVLARSDLPNMGSLATVGALGVDITASAGFDIVTTGSTNVAYAALSTSGASSSSLYTVNLDTGAATLVGPIGGGVLHALAYRP
jgi:hypothetical protein